jgi:hypothetical protein
VPLQQQHTTWPSFPTIKWSQCGCLYTIPCKTNRCSLVVTETWMAQTNIRKLPNMLWNHHHITWHRRMFLNREFTETFVCVSYFIKWCNQYLWCYWSQIIWKNYAL